MSDITSSPRNLSIDSCSTGANPSSSIPIISFDGQTAEFMTILQEDRMRVMHKRTVVLFNENATLKEQLHRESLRAKELEEKLIFITKIFSKGDRDENKQRENDTIAEVALTMPLNPLEKLQQAMWAVCKLCRRKLQKSELQEPVVFITKTELEVLEKDTQILRDALLSREQTWNKMIDKEQNYCRQLTRLAQEVITVNQVANNHHEDLKKMAQVLEEREFDVKCRKKEIIHLKKIISKQEKRSRALENRSDTRSIGAEINERERKLIEEIMQQFSCPRRKRKSIALQQKSPRHSRN